MFKNDPTTPPPATDSSRFSIELPWDKFRQSAARLRTIGLLVDSTPFGESEWREISHQGAVTIVIRYKYDHKKESLLIWTKEKPLFVTHRGVRDSIIKWFSS